MRGIRTTTAIALLAFAVCSVQFAPGPMGPAAAAAQDKGGDADKAKKKKKARPYKVDAADVVYGRPKRFAKPAEVDVDAVFAEIPEYKKIVADDLEPGSVKYELYMKNATRRFRAATRKAAKALEYDLVAKLGTVSGGEDPVPAITQEVIDRL